MFFFFQAEDGIRDADVTGVQTCALPISKPKQREAIDVGVTDAFVTAYYKGERISITEAHALLAEKGNDILELNNPTEISNNKDHNTTNNSTPRKPEELLE